MQTCEHNWGSEITSGGATGTILSAGGIASAAGTTFCPNIPCCLKIRFSAHAPVNPDAVAAVKGDLLISILFP